MKPLYKVNSAISPLNGAIAIEELMSPIVKLFVPEDVYDVKLVNFLPLQ